MAPKIIKQGSTRAAIVQQFSFLEQDSQVVRPTEWNGAQSFAPTSSGIHGRSSPNADPASATTDLAQLEKAAYENGMLQGEKAGMEIAERKMEAIMSRYSQALIEINNLKASLYAQVEREVVQLALAVAKKIVHREIQIDRDIIQTLVRVALSHVAEKSPVTIHLNPVDYNHLLERRAELSQAEGRNISLLADKSIERGGCFIQTDCGDVDARIEEEFRSVEQTFFEGMK